MIRTETNPPVQAMRTITFTMPPERIALNPDCGFAPDAGEPPTIDEAYEKLCRLVAAAHKLRERFARPAADARE